MLSILSLLRQLIGQDKANSCSHGISLSRSSLFSHRSHRRQRVMFRVQNNSVPSHYNYPHLAISQLKYPKMPDRKDVHNFAAGPSPLPTTVLEDAAKGLLNYADTGMGICELSHRGKEFKAVIEGAEGKSHVAFFFFFFFSIKSLTKSISQPSESPCHPR